MLIKENWYDNIANKQITKSYWYWITWANNRIFCTIDSSIWPAGF